MSVSLQLFALPRANMPFHIRLCLSINFGPNCATSKISSGFSLNHLYVRCHQARLLQCVYIRLTLSIKSVWLASLCCSYLSDEKLVHWLLFQVDLQTVSVIFIFFMFVMLCRFSAAMPQGLVLAAVTGPVLAAVP